MFMFNCRKQVLQASENQEETVAAANLPAQNEIPTPVEKKKDDRRQMSESNADGAQHHETGDEV